MTPYGKRYDRSKVHQRCRYGNINLYNYLKNLPLVDFLKKLPAKHSVATPRGAVDKDTPTHGEQEFPRFPSAALFVRTRFLLQSKPLWAGNTVADSSQEKEANRKMAKCSSTGSSLNRISKTKTSFCSYAPRVFRAGIPDY